MSAEILPFYPILRRSREAELWDAYLEARQVFDAEYPCPKMETLERVVDAYRAFKAEFMRTGTRT